MEEETLGIVSRVLVEQNLAAQYLAEYGRDNLNAFGEVPGSVGNLQHFLDRDLGLEIPLQVMDNMGLGEVVNAPKPPRPSPVAQPVFDEAEGVLERELFTLQGPPNLFRVLSEDPMMLEEKNQHVRFSLYL